MDQSSVLNIFTLCKDLHNSFKIFLGIKKFNYFKLMFRLLKEFIVSVNYLFCVLNPAYVIEMSIHAQKPTLVTKYFLIIMFFRHHSDYF